MTRKKATKVIVRTYSAGVHYGTLEDHDGGKVVTLLNARRIWYWQGAASLHQVAAEGVGPGSKISVPVTAITLTEAIEIILCSAAAVTSIEELPPWRV